MIKIIVWCYVLLSYLLALIIYSLTLNLPEELKQMHSFIEELENNKDAYIEEEGVEAYYDILFRYQKLEQRAEDVLEKLYAMGISTFNQGYVWMFIFAPFIFIPLVISVILKKF